MIGRQCVKHRAQKRLCWHSQKSGWSRTTVLRLRLLLGEKLWKEPVLVALPHGTAVERSGLVRVLIPHLGVEVLIRGRVVRWRRVAAIARTSRALQEATSAWRTALEQAGFRMWLSLPESPYCTDPERLEAMLVRALVMELVGRRERQRR